MDTNGDGIVDNLLAFEPTIKKKPGRKSLGLNREEMKERREMLRRIRVAKKKEDEKRKILRMLVSEFGKLQKQGFSVDDIAEHFVVYPGLEIKLNKNATLLSGVDGGRIRRPRGKNII